MLAIALPGRGHVQVRVQAVEPQRVVLATLKGHAIAGVVCFGDRGIRRGGRSDHVRCGANALDWIGLTLGGARLQDANWTRVLHNAVTLSRAAHRASTLTRARSATTKPRPPAAGSKHL